MVFAYVNTRVEIFKIFRVLGTPDEESWPGLSSLPDYKSNFPVWEPKKMKTVVPHLEASGVDLLKQILILDPCNRLSAKRALTHPYFADVEEVGQDDDEDL
jgi:serine/threonine protein kinase